MKDRHIDRKKDLENAFTFGGTRKTPTVSVQTQRQKRYNLTEGLRQDPSYTNRTNYKHHYSRDPDIQMDTSKEDALLKKFEEYERRFDFGKPIVSETVQTVQQGWESPVWHLQEVTKVVACEQTNKGNRNYNPSIQDIKRKYGYHRKEKPKQSIRKYEEGIPPVVLSVSITPQHTKSTSVYGYDSPVKTQYGGYTHPKLPAFRIETTRCSDQDLHEEYPPKARLQGVQTKGRNARSKQDAPQTEYVLQSITDLDSKINLKLQKIMAKVKSITPLTQRRY